MTIQKKPVKRTNKVFERIPLTRKLMRARAKRLLKQHGSWKLRRLGEGKWWLL